MDSYFIWVRVLVASVAIKAFVLIVGELKKTKGVVAGLSKIKGVKSSNPMAGPYDVIAMVEVGNVGGLGNPVTEKVHPVLEKTVGQIPICMALGI